MEPENVLAVMKAYVADDQPEKSLDNFAERLPTEYFQDSVDVLTFIMHLEEKLGIDIKLAQVGPSLGQKTFQELAVELCRTNEKS